MSAAGAKGGGVDGGRFGMVGEGGGEGEKEGPREDGKEQGRVRSIQCACPYYSHIP